MKLSIITINKNNALGLRKTIESVVTQSYTDFEYIIIDGASTDESVDIIKEYEDKISYWISEPDTGIYNAMNKGILKAIGEYLYFLNSGDWLVDEKVLEKVFSKKVSYPIVNGILHKNVGNSYVIDKGQLFAKKQKGKKLTLYDFFYGNLNHPSTFIKRALFDEFGLYNDEREIVADWEFFLKTIGLNGVEVEYVDIIICCFDMTGISNSSEKLLYAEREKILEELLPPHLLEDYRFFHDLNWKFLSLKKRHDFLFRYSFVYFVTRGLNKIFGLLDFKK